MYFDSNTLGLIMGGIAGANEAKLAGWGIRAEGMVLKGRRGDWHDEPAFTCRVRSGRTGRGLLAILGILRVDDLSKAGDSPPLAPPSQGGERDGLLTSRRKSSSSRSPPLRKGGKGMGCSRRVPGTAHGRDWRGSGDGMGDAGASSAHGGTKAELGRSTNEANLHMDVT